MDYCDYVSSMRNLFKGDTGFLFRKTIYRVKNEKIELLSPAGDLERLKVTLLYGADAVYLGGKLYNLRANATNFSLEDLKEGCQFAHKLGKKYF